MYFITVFILSIWVQVRSSTTCRSSGLKGLGPALGRGRALPNLSPLSGLLLPSYLLPVSQEPPLPPSLLTNPPLSHTRHRQAGIQSPPEFPPLFLLTEVPRLCAGVAENPRARGSIHVDTPSSLKLGPSPNRPPHSKCRWASGSSCGPKFPFGLYLSPIPQGLGRT